MEGGSESSKDFGLSKKVETNSQKEEAPMDEKAKIIELEKIKGKTEDEEKKEDLNKIEVGVVIEETKKGDVKEIDKMKNGEGKKDDVKEINEMKNDEDNEEEVKVINEMRNDERDINKDKEETTPSGFDPDNPNIHPNKSDVNKSKEEKEKVEVIKEIKNEEVKKEDVTRNDPIDETKKEDDHTTSEGEAIRTEDEKKLEKEKGDESNEKDEKNLREVKGDESKEKDEKNLKEEKGDESEEKDEKNISDIDVKGKAVTIDQNPKFVEETNKHVEVVEGEASVSSSSSCNVVVSRLSFKEESNLFSDLKENEKKALVELRSKVEEAINGNQFFKAPENGDQKEMEKPNEEAQGNKEMPEINGEEKKEQENDKDKNLIMEAEDIKLWGVPLSQSNGGSATDAVLLKFLRARDFKIIEAFEMLRNTLQWRKENKMDSILDEDLGNDFRDTSYISGNDRQGHPVCYNVFGVFDDDEMYNKTLGTEENREKFLRWRLRLMEEGIEKIDFIGVSSMMQINDLKNTPGPSKKEVRLFMKQVVSLLQDNYPEFVVKNVSNSFSFISIVQIQIIVFIHLAIILIKSITCLVYGQKYQFGPQCLLKLSFYLMMLVFFIKSHYDVIRLDQIDSCC